MSKEIKYIIIYNNSIYEVVKVIGDIFTVIGQYVTAHEAEQKLKSFKYTIDLDNSRNTWKSALSDLIRHLTHTYEQKSFAPRSNLKVLIDREEDSYQKYINLCGEY